MNISDILTHRSVRMMSAENQHQELQDLAHKLRIHSVKMTQASNSGHPTSCSSMAEIMSVSVTQKYHFIFDII